MIVVSEYHRAGKEGSTLHLTVCLFLIRLKFRLKSRETSSIELEEKARRGNCFQQNCIYSDYWKPQDFGCPYSA